MRRSGEGSPAVPVVLVVAGLDPTGRAGLLADVETLHEEGVRAAAVVTALTAQGGRFASVPTPPRLLAAQLEGVRVANPVSAVKLGMVATRAQWAALLRALPAPDDVPWVLDPLTATSRGERLSDLRPKDFFAAAGPGTVITPNLAEARWLLGSPRLRPRAAAAALLAEGFGAVVVKSAFPSRAGDLFAARAELSAAPPGASPDSELSLELEGVPVARGASARGTGCRFASALAAALVKGHPALQAAQRAKEKVAAYLSRV